jgi:hypothetical protein
MCYVISWKPLQLTGGIVDPEDILVFEGCGLINTPSWHIIKRPASWTQPKKEEEP